MQFRFQSAMNGSGASSPTMLRRLFAHNLFLNTSSEQIQTATGAPQSWARRWIRITHKIAPWFLFAALGILIPVAEWYSLVFIPFFLVSYFLFSLQSVRNGGIILPTAILLGANALPWIPGVDPGIAAFLATLSGALWCNRFSWWYADYSLSQNPALGQLFRGAQGANSGSSSSNTVADAEVIEVTTIEPTKAP